MSDFPPFQVGDKVKTDFYKKDRHLVRVVEDVYRKTPSESGWFIATRDEYGRGMAVDANWYWLAELKGEGK